LKKVFVLLFLLPLITQAQFTLADTLRGSLRPERTCFDVHYYNLNIAVDTATKSISGYNEIHFSAEDDVDRIQLDLFANMQIDSIVFRKFHLDYKRTFNAVFIDFPGTILKGYQEKIRVYYHGSPQIAKKAPWDGGFVWTKDKNGRLWMGVACEGAGASLWWPNKDHLSDEPDSMRITCAVPEGLQCISNGNLEWQRQNTFQWKVSYPINNYNVTLNIGDYVHFREYYVSGNDSMPCDYYVLSYNLEKAKVQFKQVKPMLKIYEELYGRYPFWNDGYALVETPYLGMEHQGAIAYGNRYLSGYRGQVDSALFKQGIDFDYIIIHESAHEYWGNSVSVQDIADLWIHESFATYTEALYVEKMHGHCAYMDYMQFLKQGIDNDEPIIGTYGVNSEGSGDMYPKGAWMLHTIRSVVNNDSLFFACLKGIQEEFKMKEVTTIEIQNYMMRVLKMNLSRYFKMYLEEDFVPKIKLSYKNFLFFYLLYVDADLSYDLFPITYTIDGINWNKLEYKIVGHITFDGGVCVPILDGKMKLSSKQFKSLRFNNDLYLYDVKISKKAKN